MFLGMESRDGRHRQRRAVAPVTADERRRRVGLRRAEERRQQRDAIHRANRCQQEPAAAAAPALEPTRPGETRRELLRRWRAQRDEQRRQEAAGRGRQPAPFRPAGAVHHPMAEYRHLPAATRTPA
ncbi:hypothetical protein FJT64_004333 [Amphibalanus amphitrite]|uniref:Uncharacterized protein n=1 Tax=Amphibalanus amphitrite TaxID=1232801 RepID=A0A6A4W3J4_AMPAM|nr:hypothetical protein FJT64_004333 [Amphibalanus amphitrite]